MDESVCNSRTFGAIARVPHQPVSKARDGTHLPKRGRLLPTAQRRSSAALQAEIRIVRLDDARRVQRVVPDTGEDERHRERVLGVGEHDG